mmetsp:Transcript_6934/g.18935  ORF Transcript_6934/g.18935 Transcript_6934/m.18935 type:complete len:215 (-) Transcript_6934:152-796(-)
MAQHTASSSSSCQAPSSWRKACHGRAPGSWPGRAAQLRTEPLSGCRRSIAAWSPTHQRPSEARYSQRSWFTWCWNAGASSSPLASGMKSYRPSQSSMPSGTPVSLTTGASAATSRAARQAAAADSGVKKARSQSSFQTLWSVSSVQPSTSSGRMPGATALLLRSQLPPLRWSLEAALPNHQCPSSATYSHRSASDLRWYTGGCEASDSDAVART